MRDGWTDRMRNGWTERGHTDGWTDGGDGGWVILMGECVDRETEMDRQAGGQRELGRNWTDGGTD